MKTYYILVVVLFSGVIVGFTGCKISETESAARSLNRDFDLARSPYQYKVSEDETKLLRVLRIMPLGETAADATLREDIERVIQSKLQAPPKIVEIRIFETHPELRREVWVVEHEEKRMAFDIKLRPTVRRGVDYSVEGPVEIEGTIE